MKYSQILLKILNELSMNYKETCRMTMNWLVKEGGWLEYCKTMRHICKESTVWNQETVAWQYWFCLRLSQLPVTHWGQGTACFAAIVFTGFSYKHSNSPVSLWGDGWGLGTGRLRETQIFPRDTLGLIS